jgi:hypothetical protein
MLSSKADQEKASERTSAIGDGLAWIRLHAQALIGPIAATVKLGNDAKLTWEGRYA